MVFTQKADGGVIYPFIHIPKCAGSEFWECFWSSLPRLEDGDPTWSHMFPSTGWSYHSLGCSSHPKGGAHCTVDELEDCLVGGFATTPNYKYSPQPTSHKFITILRNPVTRVLSEYYWWTQPGKVVTAWPNELILAAKDGLKEWVLSPYNVAHNRMVKHLAPPPGIKAPVRAGLPDCMAFNMTTYFQAWSGQYGHRIWEGGLEDAINRDVLLVQRAHKAIFFAALQEDMDASVAKLRSLVLDQPRHNFTCGPGRNPKQYHKSHAPPLDAIDPQVIREIKNRNKLDEALYESFAKTDAAGLRLAVDTSASIWASVVATDFHDE